MYTQDHYTTAQNANCDWYPATHMPEPAPQRSLGTQSLSPPRILARRQHLFRTGDTLHNLYVVRSGCIKTCQVTEAGEEHVFGFHMPGEVIGLDAMASGRYLCDAIALQTSSVYVLPVKVLEDGQNGEAAVLQSNVMRSMSLEILRLAGLLRLERKTADQRLAAFLLAQSEHFRRRGYSATCFTLPMSRRDIGRYLDLATETVSRVIARFQASELVTVDRHEAHIHDLARLHSLAEASPEEALCMLARKAS